MKESVKLESWLAARREAGAAGVSIARHI